jgi:hypothetical protein
MGVIVAYGGAAFSSVEPVLVMRCLSYNSVLVVLVTRSRRRLGGGRSEAASTLSSKLVS